MIHTAIYKNEIQKIEKDLFDLGGQDLIDLQKKNIKVIQKILKENYKSILSELKNNTEVKINDLLIDQEQFKKTFNENQDNFVQMIIDAFNIGKVALDDLLAKEITIEDNFGLTIEEIQKYAEQYSALRITQLDETTIARINKLITGGIEQGWGYNKLAKELLNDYAFSDYRARLIASNEIGVAYIQGKNRQFAKYKSEYGQTGWKKWVSHRDDKTTDGCLANDNEGWIPYDQPHQSGDMTPPRFPGCRCNEIYRLYNPNE